MTRLSDIDDDDIAATHLLGVGMTKSGKSTYVAQAVKDGHTVIYIDSDNGISAIKRLIPKGDPARERILYFRTDSPWKFVHELLTAGIFRWNLTKDGVFSSATSQPSDKMVQMIPSKIPSKIILCIDSWTSVSFDAMEVGAKARSLTLLTMKDDSQGVYGEAALRANLLCAILQQCKMHVIVLAHPTLYEIYKKPKGRAGDIKQKDMILTDSVEIPASTTRPHGHLMGKYFTDIGWFDLDTMGKRTLDFTPLAGRVSGGTVNKKGTVEDLSFSKIFASPVPVSIDNSWIKYMTAEEFSAAKAAANPPAPKPAGVNAGGAIKKTPANPVIAAMMKTTKEL